MEVVTVVDKLYVVSCLQKCRVRKGGLGGGLGGEGRKIIEFHSRAPMGVLCHTHGSGACCVGMVANMHTDVADSVMPVRVILQCPCARIAHTRGGGSVCACVRAHVWTRSFWFYVCHACHSACHVCDYVCHVCRYGWHAWHSACPQHVV